MDLAKLGDKVACSCKDGPHRIVSGASNAMVDGIPIARVGDKCSCGATITDGVAWYPIEGAHAAIHGSATSCGGQVITGCSTEVGSLSAPAHRPKANQQSITRSVPTQHLSKHMAMPLSSKKCSPSTMRASKSTQPTPIFSTIAHS
ncbi:PAAR domain-containing protein [Franzmannia pantelleriensis]|uniref:PAAR domain-containing protein n=1 Tax=Franzmannia pantelleriensis TaxID=48727 RepID=UPI000B7C85EE|nr:PAAR domain-containing protein [Halomonas pantelleriensis]